MIPLAVFLDDSIQPTYPLGLTFSKYAAFKFNLGELERVKEYIVKGVRPPTLEEEGREKIRNIMEKRRF